MKNKKVIKSTTSSKSVTLGTDEYVHRGTGVVEELAVVRMSDVDWNFEKIWLFRLVDFLGLAGGSKIKVLSWMLENRDRQNRVISTQAKIASGAQVSRRTVSALLSEMKQEGLITSPQNGVYRIDPNLIWQGKHDDRMKILFEFRKEKAADDESDQGGSGAAVSDAEYDRYVGAAE